VALMILHHETNVLTFALGADLGDEAGSVVPRGDAFDSVVSRFEARSRDEGGQALGSITRAEVTGQSLGNSSERAPCGTPEPSREQREGVYRVMDDRKANPRERSYGGQVFNARTKVKYHVFHKVNGTGRIPEAIIRKQHDVLQEAFDDSQTTDPATGKPEVFTFEMLQINYVADDDLFISCGNGNGWQVRRRFTVDVGTTMNVFICNMGPLGFVSDFPDNNASTCNSNDSRTCDGVFIDTSTVPDSGGSFGDGDTLVHEAGHYFGAFHTFNYGSCDGNNDSCGRADCDGVDDTPLQRSSSSGCPIGRDSCPGQPTPAGDELDPIRNYMDYSFDSCMFQTSEEPYARTSGFTTGQRVLMMDLTARYRAAMLVNPGPPSPPPPPPAQCDLCTSTATVEVLTDDYCEETSWDIQANTAPLPTDCNLDPSEASFDFGPTASTCDDKTTSRRDVTGLCPNTITEYTFTIRDRYGDGICCGYGSGSYSVSVDGVVLKTGGVFGSSDSFVISIDAPIASPPPPPPSPPPSPPPPSPPPPSSSGDGSWIISKKGKGSNCDKICNNIGKTCIPESMTALNNSATFKAALAEAGGPTCNGNVKFGKKLNRKAGVPGYRIKNNRVLCFGSGDSVGVDATCAKVVRNFYSLCYCK